MTVDMDSGLTNQKSRLAPQHRTGNGDFTKNRKCLHTVGKHRRNAIFRFFRMVCGAILILTAGACGRLKTETPNPHHGAFFRTEWQPVGAPSVTAASKRNPGVPQTEKDFRDAIVRETLRMYKGGTKASHYGEKDVAPVFKNAGCPNCWPDSMDAPAMVKEAVRIQAYHTRARPEAGDLILFHNQVDRNRNGRSDDWFTGVAIVIDADRHSQVAITRTGGVPRRITISPEGPMIREYKGQVVNSFVRIPNPHDPTDAQYLSGQLYAGFIDSEAVFALHKPR